MDTGKIIGRAPHMVAYQKQLYLQAVIRACRKKVKARRRMGLAFADLGLLEPTLSRSPSLAF
jgi:hypothetical protein